MTWHYLNSLRRRYYYFKNYWHWTQMDWGCLSDSCSALIIDKVNSVVAKNFKMIQNSADLTTTARVHYHYLLWKERWECRLEGKIHIYFFLHLRRWASPLSPLSQCDLIYSLKCLVSAKKLNHIDLLQIIHEKLQFLTDLGWIYVIPVGVVVVI